MKGETTESNGKRVKLKCITVVYRNNRSGAGGREGGESTPEKVSEKTHARGKLLKNYLTKA